MAEILTKLIIDCVTGEQTVVPLSAEELAEREAMRIQAEADQAQREAEELAKAEAKASAEAKLLALGLSADEIAALVK
jgi:sugar-specific transcriptional regulator TrmB